MRFNITVAAALIVAFGIAPISAQPVIPQDAIPAQASPDVKRLIQELYSSDPVKRAIAALHLGNTGRDALPAVPFLIGLLDDRSSLQWQEGRSFSPTPPSNEAEAALVKIGPAAVPALIDGLKKASPLAQLQLAFALATIGDPRAVQPIASLLTDPDRDAYFRGELVSSLAEMKNEAAVDPLLKVFLNKAEEAYIRERACEGLVKYSERRVLDALNQVASDGIEQKRVRELAASVLTKMKVK